MDASLQLGAVNVTNSPRDARKHARTLLQNSTLTFSY
jgi:hypothetical protein